MSHGIITGPQFLGFETMTDFLFINSQLIKVKPY